MSVCRIVTPGCSRSQAVTRSPSPSLSLGFVVENTFTKLTASSSIPPSIPNRSARHIAASVENMGPGANGNKAADVDLFCGLALRLLRGGRGAQPPEQRPILALELVDALLLLGHHVVERLDRGQRDALRVDGIVRSLVVAEAEPRLEVLRHRAEVTDSVGLAAVAPGGDRKTAHLLEHGLRVDGS